MRVMLQNENAQLRLKLGVESSAFDVQAAKPRLSFVNQLLE